MMQFFLFKKTTSNGNVRWKHGIVTDVRRFPCRGLGLYPLCAPTSMFPQRGKEKKRSLVKCLFKSKRRRCVLIRLMTGERTVGTGSTVLAR